MMGILWPAIRIIMGRVSLTCCVSCIFLVSLITWIYFTVRLHDSEPSLIKQELSHPPPQVDLPLSSEDTLPTTSEATTVINNINDTGPGLLLVLIHASGNGLERRTAIRNTWVSAEFLDRLKRTHGVLVDYRFVLGVENISNSLLSNLTSEANLHGDMIMLKEVSDEHRSLTNRTLKSFRHISDNFTGDFHYVLKCDDDSFVNLLVIAKELAAIKHKKRLYWGEFLGACGIYDSGIYAEYRWSICETYLPYALGGGYILSMDLIKLLATNAPYLKIYNNEDISVGAWLSPYNIKRMSDIRFNTGAISRGCKAPFIVMHKVDAQKMYTFHKAVTDMGYICTPDNQWFKRFGHSYNWKAPPSKCCRISRRIP